MCLIPISFITHWIPFSRWALNCVRFLQFSCVSGNSLNRIYSSIDFNLTQQQQQKYKQSPDFFFKMNYCHKMICTILYDMRIKWLGDVKNAVLIGRWWVMTQTSNQQNFTNWTLQVKGGPQYKQIWYTNNRLLMVNWLLNWHINDMFLIKPKISTINKRSLCVWEMERENEKKIYVNVLGRTIWVHTFHFEFTEWATTINKLGLIA